MARAVRPNTIVLLSMGYDSLSTWHLLGRPTAVYFDVGSRYSAPEIDRYQKLRSSFHSFFRSRTCVGSVDRNRTIAGCRFAIS